MGQKILIDYKDVTINQQEHTILEHVDFQLHAGDFVYLIGKVGSGKSTFLKTIYGELDVNTGDALVLDYDMSRIKQ